MEWVPGDNSRVQTPWGMTGWQPHGRGNEGLEASGKESILAKSLKFPLESPPLPEALCLVL